VCNREVEFRHGEKLSLIRGWESHTPCVVRSQIFYSERDVLFLAKWGEKIFARYEGASMILGRTER
jgi:hypothetical protein